MCDIDLNTKFELSAINCFNKFRHTDQPPKTHFSYSGEVKCVITAKTQFQKFELKTILYLIYMDNRK